MSKGLSGKTIAICGTRKTEEMRILVEKQGGQAVIRSLHNRIFSQRGIKARHRDLCETRPTG